MKKLMFLSAICAVFFFSSCGNDDTVVDQITTDLDIRVTASFDGEPLQMQKEYTFCDGRIIKFSEFDFYISDIVLLKESNPQTAVTELKEVDFIELSYTDLAKAEAGQTVTIQSVPVGDYSGIRLGLGVTADLNRTQPEDYGSSSPLNNPGFYWSGWQSYIFSKIGGYADMNNDGEIVEGGADSEAFAYHSGDDVAYASRSIMQNIELNAEADGVINLNLELSSAFNITNATFDADGDSCLDISDYRGTHSNISEELNKEIMADMMTRLAGSISIEQ